jgi:hypothetical protein
MTVFKKPSTDPYPKTDHSSCTFRNNRIFYGEELLAPRPTLKLEDHRFSADRNWLFSIFAAALHVWRPSPPSAT